MSINRPPAHLSDEAQDHLRHPPEPPPGFDFADRDALKAARDSVHAEWLSGNDDIAGSWVCQAETHGGVSTVRFAADAAQLDDDNVIVHLHGGSYFLGSPMANAAMVVPVAQRSGLPVVSVDYRLAPEHRCPAAIDDALAVCEALSVDGRIAAMYGESAGGGLALSTLVAMRESGVPLPGRVALLSPWADLTCSGDSYQVLTHVDPDFPDPEEPPLYAAAYAGADVADPQASPLFADLTGLPPILIQVGSREVLLSDSCRLDSALRRAGVTSTLDVWDGLWHVWHLWQHLPESTQAFDEICAFLGEAL